MEPADATAESARLARLLFDAAVERVRPGRLFGAPGLAAGVEAAPGAVRVVAAGKAAAGMWTAFRGVLERPVEAALVVVPRGYPAAPSARTLHADHPMPDAGSVAAAEAVLALAGRARPGDAFVVLLSGGASALLAAPLPGLTLAEIAETNRLLLASGAPIADVNAVRKRLTRVSNGRLAAAASPAAVFTFALSDVAGDDPAVIGSGPTVFEPGVAERARAVAARYGLRGRLPEAVARALGGEREPSPAPPGAYRIVGANRHALDAAAERARGLGLHAFVRADPLAGEAREAGTRIARAALGAPPGTALVWGGETTVTLGPAPGRGGRNQEAALAAALALGGSPWPGALLFAGTDGIDGPTDAAGAVVTAGTAERIRAAGVDPAGALARHDAHAALGAAGALVNTGPTGTNVMDVAVAVTTGARG